MPFGGRSYYGQVCLGRVGRSPAKIIGIAARGAFKPRYDQVLTDRRARKLLDEWLSIMRIDERDRKIIVEAFEFESRDDIPRRKYNEKANRFGYSQPSFLTVRHYVPMANALGIACDRFRIGEVKVKTIAHGFGPTFGYENSNFDELRFVTAVLESPTTCCGRCKMLLLKRYMREHRKRECGVAKRVKDLSDRGLVYLGSLKAAAKIAGVKYETAPSRLPGGLDRIFVSAGDARLIEHAKSAWSSAMPRCRPYMAVLLPANYAAKLIVLAMNGEDYQPIIDRIAARLTTIVRLSTVDRKLITAYVRQFCREELA